MSGDRHFLYRPALPGELMTATLDADAEVPSGWNHVPTENGKQLIWKHADGGEHEFPWVVFIWPEAGATLAPEGAKSGTFVVVLEHHDHFQEPPLRTEVRVFQDRGEAESLTRAALAAGTEWSKADKAWWHRFYALGKSKAGVRPKPPEWTNATLFEADMTSCRELEPE